MKTNIRYTNKLIIIVIAFVLASSFDLMAQFPETFNYQAVARTEDGTPIANKKVVIEITILQGSSCDIDETACGTIWQEVHTPETNEFGLFSIDIGDPTAVNTGTGSATDFSSIDWLDLTSGSYYVKIRVDFGESEYVNGMQDMGITKLQSVPYANSAKTAETAKNIELDGSGNLPFGLASLSDVSLTSPANDHFLKFNGTNWANVGLSISDLSDFNITSPTNSQLLRYDDGTSKWINTSYQLGNISDVDLITTTPADGHVLTYNGGKWISSSISTGSNNLSGLSDVTLTTPAADQVLSYDGTEWVNRTLATATNHWTKTSNYLYFDGTQSVAIGTDFPAEKIHFEIPSASFLVSDASPYDYSLKFDVSNGRFNAGYKCKFSSGSQNVAVFGNNNEAGTGSIVGGQTNIVGANSLVAGVENNIGASNSIVVGKKNTITSPGGIEIYGGESSLIVGWGNTVGKRNSIAFGQEVSVNSNGWGSIAGGFKSKAQGPYCLTVGVGVESLGTGVTVVGRYNDTYGTAWSGAADSITNSGALFVVGNGTSEFAKSDAFIVYGDGTVTYKTSIAAHSDKRLKTNIKPIYNVFNKLNLLDAKSFNWDLSLDYNYGMPKEIQYGFIAQDVQKVFPELVRSGDKDGYLKVNYIGFIPILFEATKHQQKKIEALEAENEKLKAKTQNSDLKIQELESKYKSLENRLKALETNTTISDN